MRFFDCALRSIDADDGGFGGLPPKLKIKVRALARFTEFKKNSIFFARFLRQKWRLAHFKFVLKSLLNFRELSKHDIDIVSGGYNRKKRE